MVLSNEINNYTVNVYDSESESNNIDKYVPINKRNTTNIDCQQTLISGYQIEKISGAKSDSFKAFDNLDTKNENIVHKSISLIDNEKNHENVDNLTTSNIVLEESLNKFVDHSKYGNVVIVEFLGKTKELVSLHFGHDVYEELMDDVFSNSNFPGVCSTEVPLRSVESLPSIYRSKKYGGPKMVAFHVIKSELIPELLKINKIHVSKVWEFEDKEKGTVVKYTPEEDFPIICRLPDPVARNYSDLPIEVWGDNVNKDEKEIVKFNNTQLMKETRLLMISDCTADHHKPHQYFLGICNECCTFPSGGIELSRCGGCQLVAYCSRDCQKKDWKKHRGICKKLPVKKGRNVFTRGISNIRNEESWRNFIFELDERAHNAWKAGNNKDSYPEELIYWGRYCNTCCETQMENLFDCACGCVSYCSNEHKNMDMDHLDFCKTLYLCTQVYAFYKLYPGKVYLPYCKQVFDVFKPLTSMLDFLKICRAQIEEEDWLHVKFSLLSERLSYPLTVIYILQKVGVGPEKKSVGEIASLNLHLLSHYAMLDVSVWEMVLHFLPSLKELNVSYIGEQFIASRMVNPLNITCTNLKRCSDCEEKDRSISISVFPMHYHMYFSSEHYSEPDAIGVFQMGGIIGTEEEDDNVHATTSFRNLTYNEHVPLILTDMQKSFLIDNTSKINKARPVNVLIPVQHNPFAGFRSSRRHKCGFGNPVINDAEYVACLIQK